MNKSKSTDCETSTNSGVLPLPNENSSSWRSEFKKLQEENAAMQRKCIDLKENYTTKVKALRYYWNKSKDLEEKCKNLEDKNTVLETRVKNLEEERSKLNTANSSLRKENSLLSEEKTCLVTKNTDLLERSFALEKNYGELEAKQIVNTAELEHVYLKLEKKLQEESILLKNLKDLSEFKAKASKEKDILISRLNVKTKHIGSLETRISHFEKVIDDLKSKLDNETKLRRQNIDWNYPGQNNTAAEIQGLHAEKTNLIAALSEEKHEVKRQKEINGLAQLNLIRKDKEITNLLKCNSSLLAEKDELEKQLPSSSEKVQEFQLIYDKFCTNYGNAVKNYGECALQIYEFLTDTMYNNFKSIDEYLAAIQSHKMSLNEISVSHVGLASSAENSETPKTNGVQDAVFNLAQDSSKFSESPIIPSPTSCNPRKLKRLSQSANIVKIIKLSSDEDEEINVE